jgi:hypothetical protein
MHMDGWTDMTKLIITFTILQMHLLIWKITVCCGLMPYSPVGVCLLSPVSDDEGGRFI